MYAKFSSDYSTSGSLISFPKDTGKDTPDYQTISWHAATPPGTNLTIEVRAGKPNDWGGIDWTSWYEVSNNQEIPPDLDNYRYIQYRANFSTSDSSVTPILYDITIYYK